MIGMPHRGLVGIAMAGALALAAFRATAEDRWAKLATPVFRTYTQDDGLPHPVASAIAEDGAGFLWVGTQEGLARWDGYHFRVYRPVAGDPGALPDLLISALHVDPAGRLWVGTDSGGLALYDRDRDRFRSFTADALGSADVHSIADDGSGGVWVGTHDGLDHVDLISGRITRLRHRAGDAASLPGDSVLAVLRDHAGTLWVGTDGGLARLGPGDRFQPVAFAGTPGASPDVESLFQDAAGRFWIGIVNDGAYMLDPARGTTVAQPVRATGEAQLALQGQRIYAITQLGREIWLGTYSRGIVAIDPETGQSRLVHHDPLVRQSLPDDSIRALYQDRAGAMWVGTNAGLGRLASGAALTVFGEGAGAHGLTESNVLSIGTASDGHVWVGFPSKGLDILAPGQGAANLVPNPRQTATSLPGTNTFSFTEWPTGTMVIGTSRGLYRSDLAGQGLVRIAIPGRDPLAGVRGTMVADGRLWLAGYSDGLWSLAPDGAAGGAGPRVEHFAAGQITDRRTTLVLRGRKGDLWIGTCNGLNRLDLATRHIERILPDRADPAALATGYVSGLAFDRQGRLWVGMQGGGIAVLVGREGGRPRFRRIGRREGLPDDNVDSLLADAAGRIWASTDDGIAVIDPNDAGGNFRVHALHRADGVEISAYWDGSGAVDAAGELLFGGIGGMTVIRPELFQPWTYQPSVVATDIEIGGAPALGKLVVRPGANSLAVEFAALDYSAPAQNRYAYWLEGFDRDWTLTPASRRLAAYMNLPPGRYTLHLRGSNREGAWSPALDLPVRVLPAWHQTWWFRIAAGCTALAVVLGLVQARTIFLRRRQRELERLVGERTSELAESKRQIEIIAYHDALTGLPNRRLFTEELRELTAAAREGHEFALLMIDLDRFKQINDTLGHDAGDALLVEAARRMRACLRISDRLVRLGGDEFAVLITDLPSPPATSHAIERACVCIVESFAKPVAFKDHQMKTSASVGVAICPADGHGADAIYKAADLALYEAKREGRNTWRRSVREKNLLF